MFNYTHYSQLTGEPNLIVEAPKYTQKLLSFDHGGDYCCNDQCSIINSAAPDCCITVASKTINLCHCAITRIILSMYLLVLPIVQWELPKAVALHGDPITGSCSASGYPRPNVKLIIPTRCDYQQNNVHIGRYTNKAVFTMNVTKNCEQMYCLITSKTYSLLRTNKLLIVGECT